MRTRYPSAQSRVVEGLCRGKRERRPSLSLSRVKIPEVELGKNVEKREVKVVLNLERGEFDRLDLEPFSNYK
jgi:hypothetical protein